MLSGLTAATAWGRDHGPHCLQREQGRSPSEQIDQPGRHREEDGAGEARHQRHDHHGAGPLALEPGRESGMTDMARLDGMCIGRAGRAIAPLRSKKGRRPKPTPY